MRNEQQEHEQRQLARTMDHAERRIANHLQGLGIRPGEDAVGTLIADHKRLMQGQVHERMQEQVRRLPDLKVHQTRQAIYAASREARRPKPTQAAERGQER